MKYINKLFIRYIINSTFDIFLFLLLYLVAFFMIFINFINNDVGLFFETIKGFIILSYVSAAITFFITDKGIYNQK